MVQGVRGDREEFPHGQGITFWALLRNLTIADAFLHVFLGGYLKTWMRCSGAAEPVTVGEVPVGHWQNHTRVDVLVTWSVEPYLSQSRPRLALTVKKAWESEMVGPFSSRWLFYQNAGDHDARHHHLRSEIFVQH